MDDQMDDLSSRKRKYSPVVSSSSSSSSSSPSEEKDVASSVAGLDGGVRSLLEQAASTARYGETISLTLGGGEDDAEDENDSPTTVRLVAVLDRAVGGLTWTTTTTVKNDTDLIRRHSQTKPWIVPMLNDVRRNDLYVRAIESAVKTVMDQKRNSETKGEVWALDLGSGTGLWAMTLARALTLTSGHLHPQHLHQHQHPHPSRTERMEMERPRVVSWDMEVSMAALATQVIADNGLETTVEVEAVHSMEKAVNVDNDSQTFDLCVCELLDHGLLGEGWIPTMRDAWARHLKPNAVVLPQGARVMAALVEGRGCENYRAGSILGNTNADGDTDTDGDTNTDTDMDAETDSSRTASVSTGVIGIRAEALLRRGDLRLLTEPTVVLEVDVSTPNVFVRPPASGTSQGKAGNCSVVDIIPTSSGIAQGVLWWWELDLWRNSTNSTTGSGSTEKKEDNLTYSTSPLPLWKMESQKNSLSPKEEENESVNESLNEKKEKQYRYHWQDHWRQCLHVFPSDRQVEPGIAIPLRASTHDDVNITFSYGEDAIPLTPSSSPLPQWTPFRTRQLNDPRRWRILERSVDNVLSRSISRAQELPNETLTTSSSTRCTRGETATTAQNSRPQVLVLDVSDGSVAAVLASRCHDLRRRDNDNDNHPKNNSSRVLDVNVDVRVASVEASPGHSPQLAARLAEARGAGAVELWRARTEDLTPDVLGLSASTVVCVCAEPYTETLEGHHLQEALNLAYLLRGLRSGGVVSAWTTTTPYAARVVGCAVQLPRVLADAYRPPPTVAGTDHSALVRYTAVAHTEVVLPLVDDYPSLVRLTAPFVLGTLRYQLEANHGDTCCPSSSSQRTNDGCVLGHKGTVPFLLDGICHGMMVWIEYQMIPHDQNTKRNDDCNSNHNDNNNDNDNDDSILSTATTHHRQLLHLLPKAETQPVQAHRHQFSFQASFGEEDGSKHEPDCSNNNNNNNNNNNGFTNKSKSTPTSTNPPSPTETHKFCVQILHRGTENYPSDNVI